MVGITWLIDVLASPFKGRYPWWRTCLSIALSSYKKIECQGIASLAGAFFALFFTSEVKGQDSLRSLFDKYCIDCHNAEKQKGDVRFDEASKLDADLLKRVFEQLVSREMPPDNKPQPDEQERQGFMDHVLRLASTDSSLTESTFRRLNRREYGNTVRDLLGLQMGVFDPSDGIFKDEVTNGFDTEAKSLVISSELLLEYHAAAEQSLRQALFTGDTLRPPTRTTEIDVGSMEGIGGNRYINATAEHIIIRNGGKGIIYASPKTRAIAVPGRYRITVTAAGVDRDSYPVRFHPLEGPAIMGVGLMADQAESVTSKGFLQKTFELKDNEDRTFTFDAWIDKGFFPYISFVNGHDKPITQLRAAVRKRQLPPEVENQPYAGPGVRVRAFKLEGPLHDEWPPLSFRTTLDAAEIPDLADKLSRRAAIERFAIRAFRRPVTIEQLTPYIVYLEQQYAATGNWNEAVIRTFAAMMSSIDFLYLREDAGKLDGYALANRLSYFLWSTMPDTELFQLAQSGRIMEASVLRRQVARMLADPRADRFCDSFVDQWLALDSLGSMPPDAKSDDFRIYYLANLESAMREETRRYFRFVLRENHSVRDFIEADYSFLNADLAELYEVPFQGNQGEFARVSLPPTAQRGGLMGHASILTLSANGVDTSPVVRGIWVLDKLLGTPPPPPPKEVPALVPDLNGAQSVRDLLEKHRSDAACMECHRLIDPLGFALEAYDPIGRFRTNYSESQVVSTAGEYRGKSFEDITGLKQILLGQLRPFARNLVVRIAEYAKGRKLAASDLKAVEAITDEAAENDFRLQDLIIKIATSDLLKMR